MNQKEIWIDIKDYEGKYQVSNLGRVKSLVRYSKHWRGGVKLVRERILKPGYNKSGYLHVVFIHKNNRKNMRIHKLVAIAFLGHIPDGHNMVVNHKNFIRDDNRESNLEIITARENTNRAHLKSSSGYTGVYWLKSRKKWRSMISVNSKNVCLGLFTDESKASNMYQKALTNLDEFKNRKQFNDYLRR